MLKLTKTKEKLDVLTQAQEKANAGNKDSVITNQQLVNEIKITGSQPGVYEK